MPRAVSVKLTVPAEIEGAIDESLESGEYESLASIVEGAMLQWFYERREADELIDRIGIEGVRRLVQDGLDSGPAEELDVEEIIVEARRRRDAVGR